MQQSTPQQNIQQPLQSPSIPQSAQQPSLPKPAQQSVSAPTPLPSLQKPAQQTVQQTAPLPSLPKTAQQSVSAPTLLPSLQKTVAQNVQQTAQQTVPQSALQPSRPKSAPLPSKSKTLLKPIAHRKTSPPPNISSIPEELRLKVLNSVFNFDFNTKLDNELIFNYLKVKSKVSTVNKGFKSSMPLIISSLKNTTIINLQHLKIDKAILSVLNKTNSEKVNTIILRNISFDTDETLANFLKFFSKNTKVNILIFDNVKIETVKILRILLTFNRLEWLEISNSELLIDALKAFLLVLKKSTLQYLTFTNNTVDANYYNRLFTQNFSNEITISKIPYRIHVFYEHVWLMFIANIESSTVLNSFQINIFGNTVINKHELIDNRASVSFDFRNPFAETIKFLQ